MNNPQTVALNIGNYGCLAMCYLYCIGFNNVSDSTMIKMVADALSQGILSDDCSVKSGAWLCEYFTGKKYFVDKQKITDISNIKNPTPVFYGINGKDGHCVVVADGKIVFNPLRYSNNVINGQPVLARFISQC